MTYTNTLIRFKVNETDVVTIIQSGGDGSGAISYFELGYVNIPQNRRPSGLKSMFTSFSFYMVSGAVMLVLLMIFLTRLKEREKNIFGSYDDEEEDDDEEHD